MNNNSMQRSRAEKISLSIALFILSAIVALLILSWVNGENSPPAFKVIVGTQIRQANQHYYVPFEVINTGGQTAESVEIIAELNLDNRQENGMQQINFLAGGEKQEGAFIFGSDPGRGSLQIRVASYKLP